MKKRTKKFTIFSIIGVVVIAAVVVGLTGSNNEATMVQADLVIADDIFEKVTASGRIQPQTSVNITSEVSAQIIELLIDEGDYVNSGDVLVVLDTVQLQSDVDQAKYALSEVNARLKGYKASLDQAQEDYDIQKQLLEKDHTSETIYKNSKYAYLNSKSNYEATLAQQSQLQTRFEKQMDYLKKAKIVAPMNGVITYLSCEVGEIAQAQTAYTQGRKLMTIADLSVFEVEIDVDETEIAKIKLGQISEIKVDAFRDTTYKGTVEEIGNSATMIGEGTENYTTNFRVKIKFVETNQDIRPGMSASVDITTDKSENTVLIPYASVVTRKFDKDSLEAKLAESDKQNSGEVFAADMDSDSGEVKKDNDNKLNKKSKSKKIKKTGVFVYRGGKAEFIEVKTGIADERNIEILDGLTANDTVISGSYKTLRTLEIGELVEIDENSQKNLDEDISE